MFTILLIIYAAIVSLLFICALIGASAQNQDTACIIKNDRIVVNDFIEQLSEAKSRISELERENYNLQTVISRQDTDIETCHKLMEMQNNTSELSTLNSQLSTGRSPSTLNSQLSTPPEVPGAQSQVS